MSNYYKNNKDYLRLLEKIPFEYYGKYVFFIEKFLNKRDKNFLDIGCGSGSVVKHLMSKKYNAVGCDVSNLFIDSNKKFQNKLILYNGKTLPFKSEFFDVCGSFNVLEHVEDPYLFLDEMNRVLKKGGIGIIVCPNFLSVFFKLGNNTTKTFLKRIKNLFMILKMILLKTKIFEKMKRINKKIFIPDDDAIIKTNIVTIVNSLKDTGNEIIYISGVTRKLNQFLEYVSRLPFIKLLLSSCFIIYKKK